MDKNLLVENAQRIIKKMIFRYGLPAAPVGASTLVELIVMMHPAELERTRHLARLLIWYLSYSGGLSYSPEKIVNDADRLHAVFIENLQEWQKGE